MIPALPVDAVQRAVEAGEFEQASALLAGHAEAVRVAVAACPPDTDGRADWHALLQAQHALAARLRRARDEAGTALRRLRQGQRHAAAYGGARP